MKLSLSQAAEHLGKTRRQIRYMIQQGRLPAGKDGGRWFVDSEELPASAERQGSRARQEAGLRDAVDAALGPRRRGGRYSLRDLKAVSVGVPLYHRCRDLLGAESDAARELRFGLDHMAIGYHRYGWSDKRDAYRAARDAAARAAMALLLAGDTAAGELLEDIEQELMPAIAGVLRRTERRGNPT